jgi:hypothetical protein
MSSTDDRESRELLEAFYRERIVPTAEVLRARGARLFERGPDEAVSTYWISRTDDSDYVSTFASADISDGLRRRWSDRPELLELADEIAALASRLEEPEPGWTEVSPFIYAMF